MPALRAADGPLRRHCRNCGLHQPGVKPLLTAAFKAWQAADPERRSEVSRFDIDYPDRTDNSVDYVARARQLGIHLSPNSNWPFVISFGGGFLAFAAIPFPGTVRIVLAVIGGLILLWGLIGWVVIEDTQMFPTESPSGEVHH